MKTTYQLEEYAIHNVIRKHHVNNYMYSEYNNKHLFEDSAIQGTFLAIELIKAQLQLLESNTDKLPDDIYKILVEAINTLYVKEYNNSNNITELIYLKYKYVAFAHILDFAFDKKNSDKLIQDTINLDINNKLINTDGPLPF